MIKTPHYFCNYNGMTITNYKIIELLKTNKQINTENRRTYKRKGKKLKIQE